MIKPQRSLPHMPHPPRQWNDWLGWLRYNAGYVQDVLRQKGELEGSMFTFHSRDGLRICHVGFQKDIEKASVYRLLSLAALAFDSVAVCMMSEAWVLNVALKPGEDPRGYSGVLPSQSERRIEVATATMLYRTDDDQLRCYASIDEILRGDDGKITGFKSILTDDEINKSVVSDRHDSLLTTLIEVPPASADRRLRAQQAFETMRPIMHMVNVAFL